MRSRSLGELQAVLAKLGAKTHEALLLLAPNYEPRSVLGVDDLLSAIDSIKATTCVELWTLQARHNRVEPLEFLKSVNVQTVTRKLAMHSWRSLNPRTLPYPETTENLVESYLRSATDGLGDGHLILLDISTLPRRLIVALLKSSCALLRRKRAARLFFLYCWVERYPWTPYAAEEGELKIVETDELLSDAITVRRKVLAAILCGRQGFDARQLLETLPPASGGDIQVYVLVNRFDLYSAFQIIKNNATVITSSPQMVKFYLSIASAHEMLMERSRNYYPNPGDLFLIAPFGPKPLIVTTYLSLEHVRRRGRELPNFFAGTIALTGHQYNTTYSLGYSHWEVLEIEPEDLPAEEV